MAIKRTYTGKRPVRSIAKKRFNGFSKVDLKRAVDAAQKSGLEIGTVEIRPDGTISLQTVGATSIGSENIFDRWDQHL